MKHLAPRSPSCVGQAMLKAVCLTAWPSWPDWFLEVMPILTSWALFTAADAPTPRCLGLGCRVKPGQSSQVILTCSKMWKPLLRVSVGHLTPQNCPHSGQESLMLEILKQVLLVLSLSLVKCQYPGVIVRVKATVDRLVYCSLGSFPM